MSKLPHKYTYRSALIAQLFESTDNMKHWCIVCNPKYANIEGMCVNLWSNVFLQNILGLDKRADNWTVLYFMNEHAITIAIFVLLVLLIVMSIIYRFTRRTFQLVRFSSMINHHFKPSPLIKCVIAS